jgi:PilZ domain
MSLAERRRENRIACRVPFEYRSLSNPSAPSRKGTTQNISPRGVYFTTDYPFQVGALAELMLEFPKTLTGKDAKPMHCTARVMRVVPAENGLLVGVGMFIERMESARIYLAPAVRTRPGAAGAI